MVFVSVFYAFLSVVQFSYNVTLRRLYTNGKICVLQHCISFKKQKAYCTYPGAMVEVWTLLPVTTRAVGSVFTSHI